MADKEKVNYEFSADVTKLLKSLRTIARESGFTRESMETFVKTAIQGMGSLGISVDVLEQNIRDFYNLTKQNGKQRMFGDPTEAEQFIDATKRVVEIQNQAAAAIKRQQEAAERLANARKQVIQGVAGGQNTQQMMPAMVGMGKEMIAGGQSMAEVRKELKLMGVDAQSATLAIYRLKIALGQGIPEASKEATIAISGMRDKLAETAKIKDPNKQTDAIKANMRELIQTTGLTAEQIAQQLSKIPGMQAAAIKQATLEVSNSQKGLKFLIRQTMGDITKIINTAFGVSFAMIFFQAAQKIKQFFDGALKRAQDYENNLRELRLTEKLMSEAGIEVTNKGLDKIVDNIVQMKVGLTEVEAVDIVGQTGLVLRNVKGITALQVEQLSYATAYLKTQDATIDAQTILNAVVDRNDRAVNKLGVNFSAASIAAKAVEMNLIPIGGELTEQVKTAATIQIIYEQTAKNLEAYKESIKGTAKEAEIAALEQQAKIEMAFGKTLLQLKVAGKRLFVALAPIIGVVVWLITSLVEPVAVLITTLIDLTSAIGKQWSLLWKMVTDPANIKKYFVEMLKSGLEFLKKFQDATKNSVVALPFKIIVLAIKTMIENMKLLGKVLSDPQNAKKYFEEMGKNAEKFIKDTKDLWDATGTRAVEVPETPTAVGGGKAPLTAAPEDIAKEFDNIMKDIQEYRKRAFQEQQDFNTDVEREEADHLTDMRRMHEDYLHDKAMVQAESNNDLAQENADHANEELEAELKFQEDMRQLREKFLFDLEDALAARDARQVIRLQKQYSMDVTNKTNEYELEKQERDRAHEEELEDIRNQVSNRLAELEYEYNLKSKRAEEDFKTEQARKRADHELDMTRDREEMTDRAALWVEEIQEQYGLSEKGAQDLLNMLEGFYGATGQIPELYNQTYQELTKSAGDFFTQFNAMIVSSVAAANQAMNMAAYNMLANNPELMLAGRLSPGASVANNPELGAARRARRWGGAQAKGGMQIANQPTEAVFGEAGKELALFIPWNQLGKGGGSGGSREGGGNVSIVVELNPDLVGRITENTMNGVAEVITRVARK